MQRIHPLSFGLGLASGLVVLVLIMGGMRLFGGSPRQRGFAGGTQNIARMAQRMGISEADLQKEIDSGKTMQEIAQEHGVTFGGRPGQGVNASATTSSGSLQSSAQSVSSSSLSSK